MILKLTAIHFADDHNSFRQESVLIGTENIVKAEQSRLSYSLNNVMCICTKIESRGAMVTTTYVVESIDEIYKMTKL